MYDGVPKINPVLVIDPSPATDAMPKSASLAGPTSGTITLPGLTSRWTMPASWAMSSAASSSTPIAAARAGDSGPVARTTSSRVGADTSSMTRYAVAVPASASTSKTVVTDGWLSCAAARASRMTRARIASCSAAGTEGGKLTSFSATSRPSRSSRARHTTPTPPRPNVSAMR